MDDLYYKIYATAHNNAVDLLSEAELLLGKKAYARAFAIAYTALEEISKSQFAADVYTGLHTDKEFKDFYKNHSRKLERVQWVYEDANSWPYNLRWVGPDPDDVVRITPGIPVFQKRQGALYVDVDFSTRDLTEPKGMVSQKDAEGMIQLVEVAIDRIVSVERDQGRIGTKGFMK